MLKKHTILIIEDDKENLESLSEVLSTQYNVISAQNGENGLKLAQENNPSLILLDIFMAGMDGISTCNQIRKLDSTKDIPVFMLSGTEDEDKRISCFSKGADDFIQKPYRIRELIARIESKIRRVEENLAETKVVSCGNLSMHTEKMEVFVGKRQIKLSALEFKLLKFFVDHQGQVLDRNRILQYVWGPSIHTTQRVVDTHLVGLKKVLNGGDEPFTHEFVSKYGKGYSLREKIAASKAAA